VRVTPRMSFHPAQLALQRVMPAVIGRPVRVPPFCHPGAVNERLINPEGTQAVTSTLSVSGRLHLSERFCLPCCEVGGSVQRRVR
jgi:hypothetical protein